MRFLPIFLFSAAILAVQDDLFSPDFSDTLFLSDDSTNKYDATVNADVSDQSLFSTADPGSSGEAEISSSCLGESSDPTPWGKRIRGRGDACLAPSQPLPLKNTLPGWANDLGDRLKDIFFGEESFADDDTNEQRTDRLIDMFKCRLTHPFNLCCLTKSSTEAVQLLTGDRYFVYDDCGEGM